MDCERFEKARQARDPRFDGRFFIGVKTTHVYCRPVCPVRIPKACNVVFFETAAAAAEAGFRPCLRCRPESAPGTPAWMGTSTTVRRALRLIGEGALDRGSVADLALRLGVTSRHLGRLFARHVGASPAAVARTRRLHFAKKLLDETHLPITEVALSAGYGSVRRFNDHFRSVYDRAPNATRKGRQASTEPALELALGYRPPFDFRGILDFLAARAVPGVEEVDVRGYTRTIELGGHFGRLSVRDEPGRHALRVRVELDGAAEHLLEVLERTKRLFDLAADPLEIGRELARDRDLAELVRRHPGQRVPGTWDPFEVAVCAIVGQQVSVAGATTTMGRIATAYGEPTPHGPCFPRPSALAELDVEDLPMPRARARAIRDLAAAVASGAIDLGAGQDAEALCARLLEIKGIGPWTAQYIAMRALGDPDAFMTGDLVLRKVAEGRFGVKTDRALLERAERWRPWRAYAALHLWRHAAKL